MEITNKNLYFQSRIRSSGFKSRFTIFVAFAPHEDTKRGFDEEEAYMRIVRMVRMVLLVRGSWRRELGIEGN